MKRIYFLLLGMIMVTLTWSQTTYTWVPPAGGVWTVPGNWNPIRTTPNGTDLLIISTGTTLTITNLPATQTIGRLTIGSGAGNNTILTLGGTGSTLTIGNQTGADVVVNSTSELNLASVNITLANNATATIAGLFGVGAGLTYDANNGANLTTVTGTIENTGTINTTAGTLSFGAASTYTHLANGGVIPTATWNVTSTCSIEGITNTATPPGGLNQTFGNVTWNSAGQTSTFSLAGALDDIAGNLTITSTGAGGVYYLIAGGPITMVIGGSYIQTGGAVTMAQTSGSNTLDISGNMNITGGTLTQGGGTAAVVFNGAAQTYTKTAGTMVGNFNFSIANNSIVDAGTSLFTGGGTFTLNNGGAIITSNTDGLYSTTATGTVQVTGARTYSNGGSYEFRGANTGSFATTGNDVDNLTLNRAAGVTLNRSFDVGGVLTLTAGIATVPSGITLTVLNAGATAVAGGGFGATKYINTEVNTGTGVRGVFAVENASAGTRIYPVGNGIYYLPITLNFTGNSDFSFTTYKGITLNGQPNGTPFTGPQSNIVMNATYVVGRAAGTGTVAFTPSWPAALEGANFANLTGTQLGIARYTAGAWDAVTGTGGSNTTNVVTRTFNPITTAATSYAVGYNAIPLAVTFADVKASATDHGVQVEWSNLTEEDVATYSIERSTNGQNFATIGQVMPKNNLGYKESYTYFDATAQAGTYFYRLRVNETTGKVIYSKTLRVSSTSSKTGLAVYPNPVTGSQLQFTLSSVKEGNYRIRIVGSNGQDIFQKSISNQGSSVTASLELPASIKPGVYTLMIKGDNYSDSKLFIVR